VRGNGVFGYLRNIPRFVYRVCSFKPDVIHAHYSFCGFIAAIVRGRPVVTSLMGSDVKCSGVWRLVIRIFAKKLWSATIVKSEDMKHSLGVASVHVIPNGVDIELFKPANQDECRRKLNWDLNAKIVLFAANPDRPEKNYALARDVMHMPQLKNTILKVVHGVKHDDMPLYLNAADVLLLTSLWEGSPNVVKEAMACNLQVVSTDVGDVEWLLAPFEGSCVRGGNVDLLSVSLLKTVAGKSRSRGRERLTELCLDSISISERLIKLYKEVLNRYANSG
jgi:glycosyltransferase involved in cell wall biosynthesis